MADLRNPEFSAVGIDINIKAAEMHLLINDVPALDPGEALGGDAEIDTQIRLNSAFRKGRNTVAVMLRMLPDNQYGNVPFFRMDMGYWDFTEITDQFDGRPMVVRMQVDLITPEAGGPAQQRLTSQVDALPLMGGNEPARAAGGADGWVVYRFDVTLDVDLPPMAWMEGQVLEDTPTMRQSLIAEMQTVHRALGQGSAAARPYLEDFVARAAASLGAPVDAFYERSVAPLIDDPDYKIVPLNVSEAELRLFGNGRLASFVPLPHRFASTVDEGWETNLSLYYWKDQTGQWRLIH